MEDRRAHRKVGELALEADVGDPGRVFAVIRREEQSERLHRGELCWSAQERNCAKVRGLAYASGI